MRPSVTRYPNVRPPLCGISSASTSKPPSVVEARRAGPRRSSARAAPPGRSGSAAATWPGAARRWRRAPSSWSGRHSRTSAPSWSTARRERQALGVVPVQVAEQERRRGTGAPSSSAPRPRSPVPASSTRRRRLAVAGQRDARRVAAVAGEGVPGRRGRPPDAEHVDPHRAVRLRSSRRWPWLTSASLSQVELDLAGLGHLARRHGDEGGRPPPTLEHRPLADQRARAEVGDLLAVDHDLDDAVEQEVDRVGLLALLGEGGARLELADLRLALAHDHPGQLPLEGRLDRRRPAPASPRRPTGCARRTRGGTSP